jgi:hypothetical protein
LIRTDEQRRWWFATHPEYSSSRKIKSTGIHKWWKAIEQDRMVLEADPHTLLDVLPYRRLIMSPRTALGVLFRNTVRDSVIIAAKGGKSKGPGEWVEVARSYRGLEHQSKMSGKPIIYRDGKHYIEKYRVPGTNRDVDFDDYRDGKYYEYKAIILTKTWQIPSEESNTASKLRRGSWKNSAKAF